jgi:hypothetical protein
VAHGPYHDDGVSTSWLKVENPDYTRIIGRKDLFERRQHAASPSRIQTAHPSAVTVTPTGPYRRTGMAAEYTVFMYTGVRDSQLRRRHDRGSVSWR